MKLYECLYCAAAVLMLLTADAGWVSAQQPDRFLPNALLGDGSGGRVWRQWVQQIPERGVEAVLVVVQKKSGGRDTSMNLRFGRDGAAFENGRRVELHDNRQATITWNVGGARPNGQPLILNVYKGEVQLSSVEVRYSPEAAAPLMNRGSPLVSPDLPGGGTAQGRQNRYGRAPAPLLRPRDPLTRQPGLGQRNYSGNSWDGSGSYGGRGAEESCRRMRGGRPPRIEVGSVRPAGRYMSGTYLVEGSAYGACVEEAGYFENGRLRSALPFPYTDAFRREEFSFEFRPGRRGEIRIYTSSGGEDVIDVDRLLR